MLKAMKKLKFLSRKRRKKKTYNPLPYYPPPPPPSRPPPPPPLPQINHYFCCSCSQAEPSAPPLPPSWFTSDEADDILLASEEVPSAGPESEYLAMLEAERSSSSYQQYMVPNPVYGIPVPTQTAQTERSGGLFGCVLDFGKHFIRCFIPCYRIKELE